MLQGEHSAIYSNFIKLPFSIKTFVLTIFEWQIKTGFTFTTYKLRGYVHYMAILAPPYETKK